MDSAPPFQAQFLLPRYWPTWLGILLVRVISLLPLPVLIAVGEGLGTLLGKLLKSRRRVVRTNLRLCLPELDEAAREKLADAHFAALGAGLFEAGLAWFASDRRMARITEVRGIEHLDAALADGRGVLLLTGHFTTLELGASCVGRLRHFHAMYRPINNRLLDYFIHRWRGRRAGLPALPKDDLKKLVRALREGRIIWYAPDQTLGHQSGAFLPLFGMPTFTITATSRLAQMGRARVVSYFPRRENGRYILEFGPALENFPSGDDVADAARVNQVIEAGARKALAQYFWIHRRFKQLPPGEPDPYRTP